MFQIIGRVGWKVGSVFLSLYRVVNNVGQIESVLELRVPQVVLEGKLDNPSHEVVEFACRTFTYFFGEQR